jgi:3-hydroxyisobutyrate dehydrogenase-like beta-hydroxyacid dehydrogenase
LGRYSQIPVEVGTTATGLKPIPSGIIQSAKQGDIVLCMSTIDLLAARRFAERPGAKGVVMLDASVSGGTHGAAAATLSLSVIVGGPTETFAASEDLFRAIGENVFHVGGLGHGLAMKLINNMLGQIATVAIAGALVLGKKAGLDPQKIHEVVRQYRQQRAVPIASSMKRRRSTAPNGTGVSTVIDAAARSSLKWRRCARVIASFRMIV